MSNKALNLVQKLDLPPMPKYTLYMLANRANDDFIAWPSLERLAKDTGLTRRSIIMQIAYLIKNRFIIKLNSIEGRSNSYKLQLFDSERPSPSDSEPSSLSSKEVVNVLHHGSERHSLPSERHSLSIVNDVHPNHNMKHQGNITETKIVSETLDDSISDVKKSKKILFHKFDEFWKVYPKREKKKEALEIWRQERLELRGDLIIADVKRRKAEHGKWLDGYTPLPTNYLSGERWNDEINPTREVKRRLTLAERNDLAVKEVIAFYKENPDAI